MISAISHAMRIIEALGTSGPALSFGQIQAITGIEKSALSRAVTSLQEGGYIYKSEGSELISLGLRLPALALGYLEKLGVLEMCQPVLSGLAEETGELIQLATSDGGPPTYIAKAQGKNRIQALPLMGRRAVPHASVAGKLWLANMSDFESIAYIQKAARPKLSTKTKVLPEDVVADIRQIRAQGYAFIADELSEGVSAIGVPLRTDRFVGALVLSSPTYRATEKVMTGYLPLLRAKADVLASVVGFSLGFGRVEPSEGQTQKPGKGAASG